MNDKTNYVSSDELREGEVIKSGELVRAGENTLGLIVSAEIDQQIATAHRYPRSIERFLKRSMDMACSSEQVATECLFALSKGGKVIEGPSVRLAEIIASNWTNSRVASRTVHEGEQTVTAQGIFHDLENNVAFNSETQRRIVDKSGKRYGIDMIVTTANAAQSIALRNAIVRGVPRAIWWGVYQQARQVAAGNAQSLATKRGKAFEAFAFYGIKPEQIYLQLDVAGESEVTRDHLVLLFGILTSIRDGEQQPEDAFPAMPTNVRREAADGGDGGKKPPTTETAAGAEDALTPEQRAEAERIQLEVNKKRAGANVHGIGPDVGDAGKPPTQGVAPAGIAPPEDQVSSGASVQQALPAVDPFAPAELAKAPVEGDRKPSTRRKPAAME